MDEHHHGRVGLLCRKHIKGFVGAIAIGNVKMRFQLGPGSFRALRPIRKMRGKIGHQRAVVVHAVVPCRILLRHAMPL